MRHHLGRDLGQRREMCGFEHPAFLEYAADDHKIALVDDSSILLEFVGHNDEIREAEFVLEANLKTMVA